MQKAGEPMACEPGSQRKIRSIRVGDLAHELGCELDEVFPSFSRTPVASASLAQVHEARLRDGRRVAVKVQYPEIEKLVRGDLANLTLLFRSVRWLEPDFDLTPLVEELGELVVGIHRLRHGARSCGGGTKSRLLGSS